MKGFGTIEFFPDIVGDFFIEAGLCIRELIKDRIGYPLREKRFTIKLEQPLLYHAAHHVRHIGGVHTIPETTLKTVAIE